MSAVHYNNSHHNPTQRNTTNSPTRPTDPHRNGGPRDSKDHHAAPKDSVTLSKSAQAAQNSQDNDSDDVKPVDPRRQDQEVGKQAQELHDAPRAKTRPADGNDAEHYNQLIHEAKSYPAGTHDTEDGSVTVTEKDGVKRLQFSEGGHQRTVLVDSKTGDVSESIIKPAFKSGPNYLVQTTTSYDRRGDVLGPVFEDRGATVPNGTGASLGPSQYYSTAPQPRPQVASAGPLDIQMILANLQGQGMQAYHPQIA